MLAVNWFDGVDIGRPTFDSLPSVIHDCATDLRKLRSVQLRSFYTLFIHNNCVAQRSINKAKKDSVPPHLWLAGCPIQSTIHVRFIYTTHAGVVMFYTSGQATWEIVPSLLFRFTWDCSVPWKFEMAWKLCCLSTCRRQYHPLKRDNHILHVSNHCL